MKLMLSSVTVVISLSVTGSNAHSYTKHAQPSCIQKIVAHCETPHGGMKASSECFAIHFDENRAHGIMDICEPVDAKNCDANRHSKNIDGKCILR